MIDIRALKLYPFATKDIAFSDISGKESFNIIYYPENTSLINSYRKLRIKKIFVRKSFVLANKIPKVMVAGKILGLLRAIKLIPILKIKENTGNLFSDSSFFLESLDERFKRGMYRRPIVSGRISNYLSRMKSSAPTHQSVLLYHVDLDKKFMTHIFYKRAWPLLVMAKRNDGKLPFDYVLLALTSGGSTVYRLLSSPENSIPFTRLYNLLKSISPRKTDEIEEPEEAKTDEVATNVTDTVEAVSGEMKEDDKSKVQTSIGKYLNDVEPEKKNELITTTVSAEEAEDIALKSILYNVSGDSIKSKFAINRIPPENKQRVLNQVKKDLLPDIVEHDKHKNRSNDPVYKKVDIQSVTENKNPSKILNKRKADFQNAFEKDLLKSFGLLINKKDFPLKLISHKRERVPVDSGDLEPSKYIKYTFIMADEKGRKNEIVIRVPEIHSDGTFLINGKKRYLIYQNILDPIYFIKPGEAKLETLYAASSIHHKHTKYKSYYDIYIGGYTLPLISLLSYHMGFKTVCNKYGIKYKVVSEQPGEGVKYAELSDNTYLVFEYDGEAAERLINSFKEIPYNFTAETIETKEAFEKAIIKITSNRNCIYKIDLVLENIMEPVATQVLKTKLLPTTFNGCIQYICVELAKGRVDKRNDLKHQRIRSSEVFSFQIQKMILASYNDYRIRRLTGDDKANFYCDTRKIVSDIVNSKLVRPLENINPLEELSGMTRITPVGDGGIPDGHALTNEARSVDPSYYGNVDPMDTPEGGNIGMINQLAVDAAVTNARGSFGDKKVVDDKAGMLSPTTVMIPYIGSCDGSRVMLAASQAKQAVPISNSEPPLVQTGYETIMTSMLTDSYIRKSPVDGVITKITDNAIYVKALNGRIYNIPLNTEILRSLQGQHALNYFYPVIKIGSKVKAGQIVAEGKHINDGVISIGTNLLIGIMGWKGYSFEDGYIISDRVAKNKLSSTAYKEIEILISRSDVVRFIAEQGKETKRGEPLLIRTSKDIESLAGLDENELREGQIYTNSPGGRIISLEIYPNVSLKQFPVLQKPFSKFKQSYEETKGTFPKKFLIMESGIKTQFSGIKIVFKIERVEPSILGDKMANSHGGKGVITYIEKYENMPVTPWGEPLDIILNPIAIVNRMNPSTLFEMYTGLIAKFLAYQLIKIGTKNQKAVSLFSNVYRALDATKDKKLSTQIIKAFRDMSAGQYAAYIQKIITRNYILPIMIPPFQAPNRKQIESAMSIVGAKADYHLKLPEFGGRTLNKVSCGYIYYKKLEHQSDLKMHARSIGKYTSRKMQPTGGKAKGGGQRIGEHDTWGLISHGATNVLRELMGPLSDDISVKNEIIADIVQNGEAGYREPKSKPTKDLLDVYIHGLMLETTI